MRMESNHPATKKMNLILIYAAILLLVVVSALYYFNNEKRNIQFNKQNELKAIAELKKSQITFWVKERFSDAKIFSQSPFFVSGLQNWFNNNGNNELKSEVIKKLNLAMADSDYSNIIIADTKGKLLLSLDPQVKTTDSTTVFYSDLAAAEKKIVSTDLYLDKTDNKIHINFISPVIGKDDTVMGVLIFCVDPDDYLFPLIQKWPSPSKTSETLIVRKEKNGVLYLNRLNHAFSTALKLSYPFSRKEIPSVKAALGFKGLVDGTSYYGTKVLAYITPVDGTSWIMVAQVNEEEIYAELYYKRRVIVIFAFLVIAVLSFALVWFYHHRQKNIYKELFIKEKELREAHEEFKIILYSIGDGVITTDTNGCVKRMNSVAEQLTGWKEEDASGKKIEEVFRIINEESRLKVENPIFKVLKEGVVVGLANHTLLISKNGVEIPIADSGAPIRDVEGKIDGVVLVFRDKSDEHIAEKMIRQSEDRLKRAELAARSGNWELHLDQKIMIASEGAARIYGTVQNEFNYETIKSVPLKEYRPMMDSALKNLIEKDVPYDIEFKIKTLDTGEIKDIHSIATYDKENKVLFGIIQDITERKKIEAERLRFQDILERSLNEIYIFDSETLKFEFVNLGARMNMKYTLEEMMKLTPVDIKPEYTDDSFRRAVKPLIDGSMEKLIFETIHERKDGTRYPVEVHLQLHRLENKNLFFAIINDITERKKAQDTLSKNEEHLRTTLYSIGDGVISTDENGVITQMNPVAERLTGWMESEAMNKPVEEVFRIINEESRSGVENPVHKVLMTGKIIGLANHTLLISKEGTEIPIADSGAPIRSREGVIRGVVLVFRDQIKERAAQKVLEESEAQLKQSQKVARIGYYVFDILKDEWKSSEMLDEIFGLDNSYKKSAASWLEIIHPDFKLEMADYLANHILKEGKDFNKEYMIRRISDKKDLWVYGLGALEFDKNGHPIKMFGTIQDITERKEAQNLIFTSLKEKEILLKEIHHRVKNNFQRIISLIALQTELISDEKILDIFSDLQSRLKSMSLIHELMYRSDNFIGVNIKDYIENLTQHLMGTYSASEKIKLVLDLEEHQLDLETIIPCGLIVNEIITNSLKYAFPNDAEGAISISLKKADGEFFFSFSDNGIGINGKVDLDNVTSLGLRLIRLLTMQIKGSLEIVQPQKGLQYIIKFKGED